MNTKLHVIGAVVILAVLCLAAAGADTRGQINPPNPSAGVTLFVTPMPRFVVPPPPFIAPRPFQFGVPNPPVTVVNPVFATPNPRFLTGSPFITRPFSPFAPVMPPVIFPNQ